jgi:membrane-associated phospholipid phosphatase
MSGKKDKKTSIKKIEVEVQQAARSESASPRVRHYRAVLFQGALALLIGAFGVLTFMVYTVPFFAIDLQITKAIQLSRSPFFSWVMNLISWPGFSPQVLIVTGLIALLIYAVGLHWEAVMAFVAAISSLAINVLVKELIRRPRPTPDLVNVFDTLNNYSFPSGHVMFYMVFFGFIWFLAFTLLKPSLKRSLLLAFSGGLVVSIGLSRIYLGGHWASDVLGAYLLGSLTLIANIQFYLWGKKRFFVHQPVASESKNV